MPDTLARLGILILVLLLCAVCLWIGRLFVAHQRKLALAAAPLPAQSLARPPDHVRILAFSSATCTQCHTLQQPALRILQQRLGSQIEIQEIDAPTSPELVQRYHILTVPSTVLLNSAGEACAVNYGFTNAGKLQAQIEALFAPYTCLRDA